MPNAKCDITKNKKKIEDNRDRKASINRKKYYLLYSGNTHCIYVELAAYTLRASYAMASCNFHVVPSSLQDIDLQEVTQILIPENHIRGVYTSYIDVDTVVTYAQALMEPGASISHLVTFSETLKSLSRPLTKETQFNDWFFDSLKSYLQPRGYVIDTEEDSNTVTQEALNEYWTSHPDCMMYKADSFSREYVSSITIAVTDDDSSQSTEEMNVEDFLPVEVVYGHAIEVKRPYYTTAGINQCYYEMSGAGARLVCMALARGKVAAKIHMYGIVVSMKDRRRCRILYHLMDFINSECTWKLLVNEYDVAVALNMILHKL